MNRILDKYDYQVTVSGIKNGCKVTLPLKLLGDPSPFRERTYRFYPTEKVITITCDSLEEPKEFQCPAYAMRLVVLSDITIACTQIGFSAKLAKVSDKNGNPSTLLEVMPGFDKKNEDKLVELYLLGRQQGFQNVNASGSGVEEGFGILQRLHGTFH